MSQYFQEKEATHQSGTNPHIASKRMLDDQAASSFMQQVYLTMLIGLGLTGISAWYVGTSPELLGFFYTGILRWIVMLAPLGLVIYLSARFHKMSFNGASTAFAIYSVVNGISLAFIFAIFTTGAIWKVFLITAGTYGAMALLGLLTNIDLSKMGSILYMALIGLIIASVVNFFMQSEPFDYIISGIGILIFCGLTAYDNQKLMRIGTQVDPDSEGAKKLAVMGALTLYLDFINLFLFLLRFFGGGDD